MFPKVVRKEDSHPDKSDAPTLAQPAYRTQREAVRTTLDGQGNPRKGRGRKSAIAWLIDCLQWTLILLELLLLVRFVLKLLGADMTNPFTRLLYNLTGFFLYPFTKPVPVVSNLAYGPVGVYSFEWSTLIAMVAYAFLFSRARYLLQKVHSRQHERYVKKRKVHSAKKRTRRNDSSENQPSRVYFLQNRGDISQSGSSLQDMRYEARQVEDRKSSTDGSTPSIAGARVNALPEVNQQFGNCILIRQLGQGGYASVYLGKHSYLKTYVALKLLNPLQAGEQEGRRFQSEASILARLRHRHIVRVLDFGWEKGIPFMVMEYAPGGTIHDYFPPGPLPASTIVPAVLQIAEALQYVHQHGLIHCDVKPENMLLGPGNEVWLSDFGNARSITAPGSKQMISDELVGTPLYMAPEQITDLPLPASDQYALAIMVYEWLCGRGPFQGSPTQICQQHVEIAAPSLRSLIPSISRSVEQVVLKALAKDPGQRFTQVQKFAYALKQASQ